jgi:Leucine-rich repeat (LRR) protein
MPSFVRFAFILEGMPMEGRNPQPLATKSRWRRISLRTFLIFVTFLCVVLGRIAATASRQRNAKKELERLGVSVMYEHEWQYSGKPRSVTSRLLEPIARHVDPNLVLPVTVVQTQYLEAPSLKAGAAYTSSDVIVPISSLPNLQSLSLTHTNVKNEDIAQLAHLSDLEVLDLHMTKMHEGTIPGLDQLRLKSLLLNRTRINDESLAALRSMNTLEHLDLTRTKVTDAGLKHLESLSNLRKLVLRRSLVTQKGYDTFKKAHPTVSVSWEPLN